MKKKHITVMTLTFLMMISALATTGLMTVNAEDPHAGSLTMHMVINTIDTDGQHAIALSIKQELAKIGITVLFDYRDDATISDTIESTGTHYNYTWDDAPNLGWDMRFWEWWGMPTSLLWWPAMMSTAGAPPLGWQTMGYNNTKFDDLLWQQYAEFDPVERRKLMLLLQQEFVHAGYGPVLYAPEFIQVVDKRFQTPWGTEGWQDEAWWYDPFIYTWNEDPMPEHVTVKFADAGLWEVYNPIYMWTYVQDMTQCQTHSMLYVVSKEYGSAVGEGITVRPYLAAADPVWADDYLSCNISLRDDVYWHNFTDTYTEGGPYVYNNEKFTADDVVLTFDALMNPDVGAWATSDYIGVLDCSVYPGGVEKLDDYTVRFHLEKPYNELPDLLANEWAAFILPEHILGFDKVAPGDWYGHWTNTEFPPPGTGPFEFVEHNLAEDYWRLEAVPNYTPGLNPFNHTLVIDEIIGYQITDMTAGWTALMNHDIHFGYGSWDATPAQLDAANATGEFWVFNSPIPAVRNLVFNLRHPILSNRYVQQAICHAIDYPHIVDDILPLAGLNGHLQATPVWRSLTQFYPTPAEEVLYNIGPYEYNIAVAQQYMDMWKYSLFETTKQANPSPPPDYIPDPALVALGPIGDNDFSGLAELDDFVVWAENVGTSPIDWPWWPCKDIDPDADNTDYVEMADFYDWRENVGAYYPFYGAR